MPFHGTAAHQTDHFQHLAKVRVAGSNPVFRSICAQLTYIASRGAVLPEMQSGRQGSLHATFYAALSCTFPFSLAGVRNVRLGPATLTLRGRGLRRTASSCRL